MLVLFLVYLVKSDAVFCSKRLQGVKAGLVSREAATTFWSKNDVNYRKAPQNAINFQKKNPFPGIIQYIHPISIE
jgi:hypothetical protein